jgi:hypothetical protein
MEMNNASEIKQDFERLTSNTPKSFNEDGEAIAILFESCWLRILVVRKSEDVQQVAIEVEVSIPKCDNENLPSKIDDISLDETAILTDMITHLQYLLRLSTIGFELHLIGNDCLWTASKTLTEKPDTELFSLLLPPKPLIDS